MPPSEAKPMHTPGPWKFDTGDGRIVGPNDQVVSLMVHAGDYNVKETFANAELIAAAPDLLAALKDIFALMDEELLVRNVNNDGLSDWAIRMVAFTARLKTAHSAILRAEAR